MNKKIYFIFLIALVLRLSLFLIAQPFEFKKMLVIGNAWEYDALAKHLLKGEFGHGDGYLSTLRTPGYPSVIAIIYYFFGTYHWLVLLFQVLISSAMVFLVYKFAGLIVKEKAAIIAAFLWAIKPTVINHSITLLSDSLFAVIIAFLFLFLFKNKSENKFRYWVLIGALTATAAYFKPIALYLPITVIIYIFYKNINKLAVKQSIIVSTVFLLMISPWIIRNKIVHDHYFFSTSPQYNSLLLFTASAVAIEQDIPFKSTQEKLKQDIDKKHYAYYKDDPYLYYSEYQNKALEYLTSHPIAFIKSYSLNILDTFFSIDYQLMWRYLSDRNYVNIEMVRSFNEKEALKTLSDLYNGYGILLIAYMIFVLCFLIFQYTAAVAGFLSLDKEVAIFLLMPIIYFVLIGYTGEARLRLPIIIFYLIPISKSVEALLSRTKILDRYNI